MKVAFIFSKNVFAIHRLSALYMDSHSSASLSLSLTFSLSRSLIQVFFILAMFYFSLFLCCLPSGTYQESLILILLVKKITIVGAKPICIFPIRGNVSIPHGCKGLVVTVLPFYAQYYIK